MIRVRAVLEKNINAAAANMANQPRFKIGVFAVILDDQNRVLLCHRTDRDLWNLPGGGLEKGEAPWEGVIREVEEETGLEVEVEKMTGVYAKPDQDEVSFTFLCKITGGKMTLTSESNKIEYLKFIELPENLSPKQVERIKDALVQNEILMKTQRGPSSKKLLEKGII